MYAHHFSWAGSAVLTRLNRLGFQTAANQPADREEEAFSVRSASWKGSWRYAISTEHSATEGTPLHGSELQWGHWWSNVALCTPRSGQQRFQQKRSSMAYRQVLFWSSWAHVDWTTMLHKSFHSAQVVRGTLHPFQTVWHNLSCKGEHNPSVQQTP